MISILKKLFSRLNRSSKGVCDICDQVFQDKDLTLLNSMALCREHLNYYQSQSWIEGYSLSISPDDPPIKALYLQNIKDLLKQQNIYAYIKTDYVSKEDQIISCSTLYIPSTNKDELTSVLKDSPLKIN